MHWITKDPPRGRRFAVALPLLAVFPLAAGCGGKKVGAVTDELLSITVVTAGRGGDGEGVEGLRVRVLGRGPSELAAGTSGSDGKAVLPLWWDEPSAERRWVEVTDPLRRFAPLRSDLSRPSALTLEAAPGVPARLKVSADGRGVAGASVRAWTKDGIELEARTSADGLADLGPLAPGAVKVLVTAAGCRAAVVDLDVSPRGGLIGDVSLSAGGSRLSGRAAPDLERRATSVQLRFLGVSLPADIDEEGNFALDGLAPCRGELVFLRRQRELFSLPVDLSGGALDLGTVRPR